MAKGKYAEWLTDDGLTRLKGWARKGLTDEQIADKMNISASTLYEWIKKYSEISEALKKTKEIYDDEVEEALHKKALEGDTTAMIFWLKNRRPNDWRDKRENLQTINDVSQEKRLTVRFSNEKDVDIDAGDISNSL